MADDLIPISDEQAKAIQEGAKLAGQSLETARALGGYMAGILGTVPQDLVGLLGGDWLHLKRAENLVVLGERTKERLLARRVTEPEPVSLSVALPLLHAAADEDREELVELWAKLLATAMDPARRSRFRSSFIDKVRRMDPIDGAVLLALREMIGRNSQNHRHDIGLYLSVGEGQVEVSFDNLYELKLIVPVGVSANIISTALLVWTNARISSTGAEFLEAVRD